MVGVLGSNPSVDTNIKPSDCLSVTWLYCIKETPRQILRACYLKRFKGIEMLDKFYDVMHTLSFKDATDDLTAFCHRQGGDLV